MATIPLAVLDLVPVSSGSTAAEALRNSIDLAQACERLGYARYWFAEHHLNPGVAGTSPAPELSPVRSHDLAERCGPHRSISSVSACGSDANRLSGCAR